MTDSTSGRSDDPNYSSGSSDPGYGSGSGDSPWSQNWSADPQSQPGSASSSSSASDWPGYPGQSQPGAQPQPPYGQPTSQPSASDPYGSGPSQQPYPPTPQYGSGQYGSNPYEVSPYQGGGAYPYGYAAVLPNHPQAVLALVLGILGLATSCLVLGIPAWVIGAKARREMDAEPGRYAGRGMATAGYVLGIVATAILGLVVVFLVIGGIGTAMSN